MPDFGRNQEPSLDEIHRSDSFIDALANGAPLEPADQADAALAAMLGSWRDENRWPPDTGLISEPQAIAALDAGLAEQRSGPKKWAPSAAPTPATPRNRRGLSVVGAAAAAMLAIGGFGAVVAGAGPGDSLYGLRTMLFGAPKQVRDDQVALAARTEMQQVQEMISRGDWQQAEEKLVAVSNQVAGIADEQQKQELLDQFNNLSAKVVERDPEATPPPGITYTVPPSATELVPAVATTSSSSPSSATDPATSTSPSASASTPSTTPTSGTSNPSSAAATTSPAATTSAAATSVPSTSAPTTTVGSTATTTATQQTATTATTTSPSAAATTTTASPKSSATTTSAPAAAATSTTSSAAPASTSSPAATSATATSASPATSAKAAPATTSAATTSAPATTAAPAATTAPAATSSMTTAGGAAPAQVVTPTTTTVLVPVPAG